jgi:hypothetical protein
LLEATQRTILTELHFFPGAHINFVVSRGDHVDEFGVNGIDKGEFTDPEQSASSSGLNGVIASYFKDRLVSLIWAQLGKRRAGIVEINASEYPAGYWQRVVSEARKLGRHAILVVPYDPIGEDITGWQRTRQSERPNDIKIERRPDGRNGGGVSYLATIEGIDVYMGRDMPPDRSLLMSSAALLTVTYHHVETDNVFVTLSFDERDDPRKGSFTVRFCQSTAWDSSPVVEFKLVSEQPLAVEATPN